jgi:hypothetical protein
MADDKPVVHALIARDLGRGLVGRTRRVDLATAYLALRAGYLVVGPDPADMEALAAWERAQQPPAEPLNRPRWGP